MDYSLADLVGMAAKSRPHHVAVVELGDDTIELTYQELWARICDVSVSLQGAEAGPNGRFVAILLPNSIDALAAYLACQRAGVAAVPLNNRLADRELIHILEDSGARTILSQGDYLEIASRVASAGTLIIDASEIPTGTTDVDVVPKPGRGSETAVVFYTSGTTGLPKGVVFSNEAWLVNTMRFGWQLGVREDERMLVPGPLFHMSYASFAIAAWLLGAQVRIMRSFDRALAHDEFRDTSTFAFLVPSMTVMLLEEWRERGKQPLTAMRSMMTSGAAVDPQVLEEAFDMFPNAEVRETYGWTEAGFASTEIKFRDSVRDGTVGYSTVGSDVAVFDEEGRRCGVGENGEVGIRTLLTSDGYLNKNSADQSRRGEWILSGDIGRFEEDGRLSIVDRKHGLIISGGENVYGAEVENVLMALPEVLECVVIGTPDDQWGELITAVIVLRDNATLTKDDVQQHCRSTLADYKCPRRIEFVNTLPRNSMGKLQRFEVKRSLEDSTHV